MSKLKSREDLLSSLRRTTAGFEDQEDESHGQ